MTIATTPARKDYAPLATDPDAMLAYGWEAGRRQFDPAAAAGEAYNSNDPEGTPAGLHVRAWELFEAQPPVELGTTTYGENAERFAVNTLGKAETVDEFRKNSGEAEFADGEEIKTLIANGAHESRGWMGAVIVFARVQLPDGSWLTRIFAVACSGVQGAIDQLVAAAVGYGIAAAWILGVKASFQPAGTVPAGARGARTVRA